MPTEFLSEENIALHKEYVRRQRLKYSILESSLPALRGTDVLGISRLCLSKRDREDAISLLSDVTLHDVFFSSFAKEKYSRSERISRLFGSEAAFLNSLFGLCKKSDHGFLTVDKNARAKVVAEPRDAFINGSPMLAIDLFEHAYFLDYGFDRERYLVLCLSYLDLSKF